MPQKSRKQFRLTDYDYAVAGAYFVTVCTKEQEPYFGQVVEGVVELSMIGKIAERFWLEIPDRFRHVSLDEFVIMPNHIHGIIIIDSPDRRGTPGRVEGQGKSAKPICRGTPRRAQYRSESLVPTEATPRTTMDTPRRVPTGLKPLASGSLSSIINHFKGNVTRYCRKNDLGFFVWQRSFYDHVIRGESSLNKIRRYIRHNPTRWECDRDYPENLFS